MPYKDKVQQREYQREWAKRKRIGEITKIVNKPLLSDDERTKRKREFTNKYKKERNIERRNRLKTRYGNSCKLCDNEYYIQFHQKDGVPHKDVGDMKMDDFETFINSNDLECLCYDCHKHVHFCMDVLHMKWEEIMSFYNRKI